MSEQYTQSVGRKFHADGSPRRFPGNTIISFVPADSVHFQLAEWVQAQVQALPFARKFSFLPPSSFHMTVKELLNDQVRTERRWSSKLPLDATLAETDEFFIDIVPGVVLPEQIAMRFAHVARKGGLTIYLEPVDEAANQMVRDYRNRVADATGTRFPDHEDYAFHISLAYRLIELTDDEQAKLDNALDGVDARLRDEFGVFHAPSPQLTFFDDMFAFLPASEREQLTSRSA